MLRGPLPVTKSSAPVAFEDMLSATVTTSAGDGYVSLWYQTTAAGSAPEGACAPIKNLHTVFVALTNGYVPPLSETHKWFHHFVTTNLHLDWSKVRAGAKLHTYRSGSVVYQEFGQHGRGVAVRDPHNVAQLSAFSAQCL